MKYKVIIVEGNRRNTELLSGMLKQAKDFELLTSYDRPESALGQSTVYNPNLFLVDGENPEFRESLQAFANLFPQAQILAMMNTWKQELAAEIQEKGITGSILKTFTADEIVETLKLSKRRGNTEPPRVISFFSPKGHAGRTTLAAMLAIEISKKTNEMVALIDADLQFGDLPIFFDVIPHHTVVDATHDIKLLTPISFFQYFYEIKNNLFLLASPDRPEYAELIDTDTLVDIVRLSGNLFKYLLIDLPAGFNPISLAISNYADINFVVSMLNSGSEIEHMRRSMDMFRERSRYQKYDYTVFTRVDPCTEEERFKIELKLGYPLHAIFPNEYTEISLSNSGRIMKSMPANDAMAKKIDELSNKIIAGEM